MRTQVVIDIHIHIADVWQEVSDLTSHVTWMHDAKEIRLRSAQHEGVGTEIECLTQVGLLSTVDILRVTSWKPRESITMEHLGSVKGTGTLSLKAFGSTTHVTWTETVYFPWWAGGSVTGAVAKPILHEIWASNLQHLKRKCEEKYRTAQSK